MVDDSVADTLGAYDIYGGNIDGGRSQPRLQTDDSLADRRAVGRRRPDTDGLGRRGGHEESDLWNHAQRHLWSVDGEHNQC